MLLFHYAFREKGLNPEIKTHLEIDMKTVLIVLLKSWAWITYCNWNGLC